MSEQLERALRRAASDASRGLRVVWIDGQPSAAVAAIAGKPFFAGMIARSMKGKLVFHSGGTVTGISPRSLGGLRGRTVDRVYAPRELVSSSTWRAQIEPAFAGRRPRFVAID